MNSKQIMNSKRKSEKIMDYFTYKENELEEETIGFMMWIRTVILAIKMMSGLIEDIINSGMVYLSFIYSIAPFIYLFGRYYFLEIGCGH